jgi:hypothetical protein
MCCTRLPFLCYPFPPPTHSFARLFYPFLFKFPPLSSRPLLCSLLVRVLDLIEACGFSTTLDPHIHI